MTDNLPAAPENDLVYQSHPGSFAYSNDKTFDDSRREPDFKDGMVRDAQADLPDGYGKVLVPQEKPDHTPISSGHVTVGNKGGNWTHEDDGSVTIHYSSPNDPNPDRENVSRNEIGVLVKRDYPAAKSEDGYPAPYYSDGGSGRRDLHEFTELHLHDDLRTKTPGESHEELQYDKGNKLRSRSVMTESEDGRGYRNEQFTNGIPTTFESNQTVYGKNGDTTTVDTREDFDSSGHLVSKTREYNHTSSDPSKEYHGRVERTRNDDGGYEWTADATNKDGREVERLKTDKDGHVVSGTRDLYDKDGNFKSHQTLNMEDGQFRFQDENEPKQQDQGKSQSPQHGETPQVAANSGPALGNDARMAALAACSGLDASAMMQSCAEGSHHEAPLPAPQATTPAKPGASLNA